MNLLNKSLSGLKNLKTFEILFFVLLVIYLLTGVSTPYNLAPYVNNVFSYASMLALVFVLFLYSNPLLAIFFGISALIFIQRSRKVDHNVMKPTTNNKTNNMKNLNSHLNTHTLEEEVVGQIVKKPDNIPSPSSYHPVLCSAKGATEI